MLRISEQELCLIMPLIQDKIENIRKKSVLENHERDVLERFESILFSFENAIEYEDIKYEELAQEKRLIASQLAEDLSEDEYIEDCPNCDYPFIADIYGRGNMIDGEFMCPKCCKNYQI